MALGTASIRLGNALDLSHIPDASVNLIITSPPYWTLRDNESDDQIGLEDTYQDYLLNLWVTTAEMARVLVPDGSIFVNLGDKMAGSGGYNNSGVDKEGRGPKAYIKTGLRGPGDGKRDGQARERAAVVPAIRVHDVPRQSRMGLPWRYALGVIDMQRLLLRCPIAWHKNAIPQNAKDRCEPRHEDIFHFAKQSPCWSDPSVVQGMESVWRIPTKPMALPPWWDKSVKRPAAFPPALVQRIVEGWCPEGGVVLDPFVGSGTTTMVARALGRRGLGVDLNPANVRLATWRTFGSPEIAKIQAGKKMGEMVA